MVFTNMTVCEIKSTLNVDSCYIGISISIYRELQHLLSIFRLMLVKSTRADFVRQ